MDLTKEILCQVMNEKAQLEREVEGLKGKILERDEELKVAREDGEKQDERIYELETEIEYLKDEVQTLQNKLDRLSALSRAKAEKIRELETLKSSFQTMEDELIKLSESEQLSNDLIQTQHIELDGCDTRIDQLERQIAGLQAEAARKAAQVSNEDGEYMQLYKKMKSQDDEYNSQLIKVKELEEKAQVLEGDVREMTDVMEQLKHGLQEKKQAVSTLQAELATSKLKADKANGLERRVQRFKLVVPDLENQIQGKDRELKRLEMRLKEISYLKEMIEDLRKLIVKTERARDEEKQLFQQRNSALGTQLNEARTLVDERSAELVKLQGEVQQISQKHELELMKVQQRAEKLFHEQQQRRRECTDKVKEQEANIKDLEGKLKAMKKTAEKDEIERGDQIESLEEELRRLNLNFDSEIAKRTIELRWDLNHANVTHKRKMDCMEAKLKAERDHNYTALETIKAENDRLKQQIADQKEKQSVDLALKDKEIVTLKQKMQQRPISSEPVPFGSSELARYDKIIFQKNQELNELKTQLEKAKTDNQHLEMLISRHMPGDAEKIKEYEVRISELEVENLEIKLKNQELKKELSDNVEASEELMKVNDKVVSMIPLPLNLEKCSGSNTISNCTTSLSNSSTAKDEPDEDSTNRDIGTFLHGIET